MPAKIDAAVTECLEQAATTARPWTAASDYLEALKARGDWSDAEIIEFQKRIIEALLKREKAGDDSK